MVFLRLCFLRFFTGREKKAGARNKALHLGDGGQFERFIIFRLFCLSLSAPAGLGRAAPALLLRPKRATF